jgi:hypothetical protein
MLVSCKGRARFANTSGDERMAKLIDPWQVIAEARVPETKIFFLGFFESRVTVLSQQRRALNLVDAIIASAEIVRPNGRVAIVGGGVSGMTAAAAFAVGVGPVSTESHVRVPYPLRWLRWNRLLLGVRLLYRTILPL